MKKKPMLGTTGQLVPMRGKACRASFTALALALVACGPAHGADGERLPGFAVRGFGTVGAVHSSEKNADFVHGFFEPNGAGHTRDWAFGVDSKLGLQVDARLTEKLSAVVQVVSQHRYDNSYTPQLEWANLKYQITPDFDVRVGRTVTMPFMISDSRLVGFANPWVRPPQEVYGLIPITNKDGIDASYKLHFGHLTNTIHSSYGQTSLKLPASGRVKAKQYFDVANTIEYGSATARVSYSHGRVDLHTTSLDALVAGYRQLGTTMSGIPGLEPRAAQALALAEKYRFEDAPISVLAIGASYDRDEWLVMAEWAKFNGHSLLADSRAWYLTAGYRIGAFTPYATAARLTADRRTEAGVSTAGLPPPLAAPTTALNTGLNAALTGARFAQKSIAMGLRWDFARSMALKLQYDRIRLEADSSGRLGNVQPNFVRGGRVDVFSVAVDFVF